MARGLLYVETLPTSSEQLADYHRWHNEVHVPEVVEANGFLGARRFEPVGHDGPFVTIYEIEADDIDIVRQQIATRAQGNGPARSPASAPPVAVRFYREISAYPAD